MSRLIFRKGFPLTSICFTYSNSANSFGILKFHRLFSSKKNQFYPVKSLFDKSIRSRFLEYRID